MRDTAPYTETKESLPASASAPPAELSEAAAGSVSRFTGSDRIRDRSTSSAGELADRFSPLDFRRISLLMLCGWMLGYGFGNKEYPRVEPRSV